MDRETVTRIEDWETRPFAGGHAGLRTLEDDEFSGAVSAGGAWVFMLNGRIVGISDGTLSGLAEAEGTAYIAPHPSLPLLFAMQHQGGETQAKYYTDDTPLHEADQMLTESNFTGYIELSENVLSGDYYIVYYGGRSLSVAFIGNAERVITGDEAFDKAADEVGIYEVRSVDLEVHDIPESAQTTSSGAVAETDTDDATAGPDDDTRESVEETTAASPDTELPPEPDGEEGSAATQRDDSEQTPASRESTEEPPESQSGQEPTSDPATPEAERARHDEPRGQSEPTAESGAPKHPRSDIESPRESTGPPETTADTEVGDEEDPFTEEKAWRKTKTVPALDPEETAEGRVEPEAESPSPAGPADAPTADQPPPTDPNEQSSPARQSAARKELDVPEQLKARITELREAVEAKETEIESLQDRLATVSDERDELEAERDNLRVRIEDLEARLNAAETASSPEGSRLEPDAALTSTDLLIRYRSKGEATLEDAMSGSASREEVSSNLQLDDHTRFDAATTTVEGQPFDRFLAETIEYQFVEWLVTELPHELRQTGNQKGLRELYSAIPEIDRAEFRGTVTTQDDAGEELSREFDIVMRDRMGQPLIVANVNDERDPATDDMMETLINDATTAAEGNDTLGAAFLVTSSFFEPEALEMATGASGGGLFNRESKKSFVKLSRKRGYHLCLAESREDTFHIAVPEL